MTNFYTDFIRSNVAFLSNERCSSIALLEPGTRARVKALIADAAAQGTDLMVFETFRSTGRQMELYNHGATKLKNVGVHNYGLACDIVKSVGGQPSWKGDFTFLGALAKAHGLIWGGDWGRPDVKHTFVDAVHVQRCTLDEQPNLFGGLWYPDEKYDPYAGLVA